VAIHDGHVARIARQRIDRKRMPLDDGPRQVKLRVLIPSAAREKVSAGDERQDRQPLGDSLVGFGNAEY